MARPRRVRDVSEVDRLRCLTGDVNEKGCAVSYVWAVGEGLRYGCGDPKSASGAQCGGRGSWTVEPGGLQSMGTQRVRLD